MTNKDKNAGPSTSDDSTNKSTTQDERKPFFYNKKTFNNVQKEFVEIIRSYEEELYEGDTLLSVFREDHPLSNSLTLHYVKTSFCSVHSRITLQSTEFT